jgi:hypothetical protein
MHIAHSRGDTRHKGPPKPKAAAGAGLLGYKHTSTLSLRQESVTDSVYEAGTGAVPRGASLRRSVPDTRSHCAPAHPDTRATATLAHRPPAANATAAQPPPQPPGRQPISQASTRKVQAFPCSARPHLLDNGPAPASDAAYVAPISAALPQTLCSLARHARLTAAFSTTAPA